MDSEGNFDRRAMRKLESHYDAPATIEDIPF
jgi:hypothetical protein